MAVDPRELEAFLEPAGLEKPWLSEEVARAYRKRYNIAPAQPVLAVLGESRPQARWLRWGLRPARSTPPLAAQRLINARVETVAERPSFREAWRRRRCAVLADGFYEWMPQPEGGRAPVYITRPAGEIFLMAGLWEAECPPPPGAQPRAPQRTDGEVQMGSCALLTTAASPCLEGVHDRMPVLLSPSGLRAWLAIETAEETLRAVVRAAASQPFVYHRVGREVNHAAAEGPSLRAPLDLPPQGAASGLKERPCQLDLWST